MQKNENYRGYDERRWQNAPNDIRTLLLSNRAFLEDISKGQIYDVIAKNNESMLLSLAKSIHYLPSTYQELLKSRIPWSALNALYHCFVSCRYQSVKLAIATNILAPHRILTMLATSRDKVVAEAAKETLAKQLAIIKPAAEEYDAAKDGRIN